MADEDTAAPSNGAGESTPVSTPAPAEVSTPTPAKSAREAVQRALSQPQPDSGREKTAPTDSAAKPEPKVDATGRVHAPDGKFAPKDPAIAEVKSVEAKPKRPPPARFAKDAHPHWETTPEPVQAEIERAITELEQGIGKYKPDAEQFEQLKAFDEQAKKSGTTLVNALHNYVGIERLLRSNPIAGTVQICRNIGIHPVQLAQHIMAIASGRAQMPQTPQQQVNPQQVLAPFVQKIGALEKTIQEIQAAPLVQKYEEMRSQKPFFELLRPTMAQVVEAGEAQTLEAAYDKALSRHPELKAAVEAQAKAAEVKETKPDLSQTQAKAALSVTGSPNAGSNPSSRKPAGSAREAVRRALSNGLN